MRDEYISFLTLSKNFVGRLCEYITENEEKSSTASMRALSYKRGYTLGINHIMWVKNPKSVFPHADSADLEMLLDIESYKKGYNEGEAAALFIISSPRDMGTEVPPDINRDLKK